AHFLVAGCTGLGYLHRRRGCCDRGVVGDATTSGAPASPHFCQSPQAAPHLSQLTAAATPFQGADFWASLVKRALRLGAFGAVFGTTYGAFAVALAVTALTVTNFLHPNSRGTSGTLYIVVAVLLAGPVAGAFSAWSTLGLIGAVGGRSVLRVGLPAAAACGG